MASSMSDSKPNVGLANSLSNVFKLADVNGLKWVRYVGPTSDSLEAPKDDPVLTSYAKLLNQGYACSWRRLSPSTDGLSGETKDLWVFYFTDRPDISDKLAGGLKEDQSGSWEDGMTSESSTMLYRSLHNIIERSLLSENFVPLGKWFVRPDSSVATDGSSRGCFLCGFSFFVHAHLYICASVDMKAGPSLQPLIPSHINQALASSTGLQVILSPSGLNAFMTGHSYKMSDDGISEILEEWKLFFPRRFDLEQSPSLPAAIEVVLGGVRMRYPSQFVFVYHGDDVPTPPPCSLGDKEMEDVMQETWTTANCIDTLQQQKDSSRCSCNETKSSLRRQSSQLDLPLRMSSPRHPPGGRYEPYPSKGTRAKELATPGSLNLMNQPALIAKKMSRQSAIPKYATPMSSPGMLPATLSPTVHGKSNMTSSSVSSMGNTLPLLPSISFSSAPTTSSSAGVTPASISTCPKSYDQSKVPPSYLKSSSSHIFTPSSTITTFTSSSPISFPFQQQQADKWWDSLTLPESIDSLGGLQLPRIEGIRGRNNGSQASPGLTPTSLTASISPNSIKRNSPKGRGRNSFDHSGAGTPLRTPSVSSGGNFIAPFPGSNGSKRRASVSKSALNGGGRGRGRGKKGGDMSYFGGDDGLDGMDSPMSIDGGDVHQQVNGLNGESMDERFPSKIDVFSDKVVKIEATSLDHIFDSDEEDEEPEPMESTHFPFVDPGKSMEDKIDCSVMKSTKLSASEPIELSRIYPTPPSVDSIEGDKFDDVKMIGNNSGSEYLVSGYNTWENDLDDELGPIPPEFLPLNDLLCFSVRYQLPSHLTYHKSSANTPASSTNSGASKESFNTAQSFSSEPEKFIFPPPASLSSSSRAPPTREGLSLPLTQHHHKQIRFSPHVFTTPNNLSSLSSSPAYPYPRAPGRPGIPRHLPSSSALTPLESPFDSMVTPTPHSATTNRLMPVLPEANGLYINLALLDSALGSNLSETLQISNGPLLSTIQNFLSFSSRRMKLDSVAETLDTGGGDGGGVGGNSSGVGAGATTDLLSCQDEKPMMTFGIADYPSLGFKEELAGMGAAQNMGSCNTLYGSLSKFIFNLNAGDKPEDSEALLASFPMKRFLELLQDYCLHVCLTSNHDSSHSQGSPQSLQGRQQHAHLLRQPDRSEDTREKSLCRLYHSHSVVSAILCAKQLVVGGGKKMGTPLISKPSTLITLSKEDNSGTWILDLLTLSTKFMTKRLKELKSVLQNSFHHAPCLKFTTKGPLTLKDLQQLTPSMTALGDECLPLPIKPVIVGYDHEWLSVSPLVLPSWDKFLFEPYAMRKTVVYMVVIPPSLSSGSSLIPLKKYFRDLSIVYKNCQLGQHVPLEKGLGEDGIVLTTHPPPPAPPTEPATKSSPSPATENSTQEEDASTTDDPSTNMRHGEPAGLGDMCTFCKKVLVSYLSSLPNDVDEIVTTCTSSNSHVPSLTTPPTPPLSIVLYVLCNNLLNATNTTLPTSLPGELQLGPTEGTNSGSSRGQEDNTECLKVLRAFGELLDSEDIPAFIRERIVLQLLDPKELLGSSSGHNGQLQSLAFSVYSRCRPHAQITVEGARSLTTFGPISDRLQHSQVYPYKQIYAPPFILSSESPLSSSGPLIGTQTHHILLDPDEPVLFCGYCISPDRRWMLVVCCDRQGELLETSVIGIPFTRGYNIDSNRLMALQKLWDYLVSIVSGSLHCWSIVITRFGKPSTSEISNWPSLITDDGLLTANQILRRECYACARTTSSRPHISNVIILSVQPERNIQLFPNSDTTPAVSHVIVLPQDPSSAPPPGMTPSALPESSQDDDVGDIIFGGGMVPEGEDMDVGMIDIVPGLNDINILEEIQKTQMGYTPATEDTSPKATGYLISTSPSGDLPLEFWGHDRPQSICSMFKILLHCHRSEKAIPDSPQETLGSTLLCFDALSWLSMDHCTRQRRTCLPIHLFILSKLYHLFSTLEQGGGGTNS